MPRLVANRASRMATILVPKTISVVGSDSPDAGPFRWNSGSQAIGLPLGGRWILKLQVGQPCKKSSCRTVLGPWPGKDWERHKNYRMRYST
jgi:hypothetical protein